MGTLAKTIALGRAASALAILTLANCGGTPNLHADAADDHTYLYREAYTDIASYYIDPVTPASLAMAGLNNLATIDASLSVERSGKDVILHYGGSVTRFAAPDLGDAEGWAALTEMVVTAARARSPAIAALSADRLDQAVIDGSTTTLDRFSHYSPPRVARERRASRDGFGGIGVTLNAEGSDIRVVEILPDMPAAAAGLHVDDRIVAIDGSDVATLRREEVANRLRGPDDSIVAIAVTRADTPHRLTFSVRRTHIVPPTVTLIEHHGIAHLRLTSFNQQTAKSVADRLAQAHREMGSALSGIILDLRGNPGGLLDQSVEVASLFLDGTAVSSTLGRVPESIQYFTAPHHNAERLPLAVLVNGGSASASEIVASALQDTGRAVVVGTSSYGKGSVQNVMRMPNDGELTITWARLITPAGYILHLHGVVPTICTANLSDDPEAISTALSDGVGAASAELSRPRTGLDDGSWKRLRELCPGRHDDHDIDLKTAQRLLTDPALYARALGATPANIARPISTAGVTR